jgi:hypothetical protein
VVRRALLLVPVFFAALVLSTDCDPSCTLDASRYDQSCTQDSDCVAVFLGDFCGAHACACENAAINLSSQASLRCSACPSAPLRAACCARS